MQTLEGVFHQWLLMKFLVEVLMVSLKRLEEEVYFYLQQFSTQSWWKPKGKGNVPVFTAASLLVALVSVWVCVPSAASSSERKLAPIVGCL